MSRWGNFLSGIESGLDKILADDASETSQSRNTIKDSKLQSAAQTNIARQGSSRRSTSRLQERLAKAVDSTPSASPDRQSKPRVSIDSQEVRPSSLDKSRSSPVLNVSTDSEVLAESSIKHIIHTKNSPALRVSFDHTISESKSPDYLSLENSTQEEVDESASVSRQPEETTLNEGFLLERIEALQAKLNLLIEEATNKARDEIDSNNHDTYKRHLAEKDEKISLLMAEGQALSIKELKNLSTIRRLHTRLVEVETSLSSEKRRFADLTREANGLKLRLKDHESARGPSASDADHEQLQAQLSRTQRQISSYKSEIDGLRKEIERSNSSELQERLDRQKQQSENDQRQIIDLKDEIETAKIERNLSCERHKAQLTEQRNKVVSEHGKMAAREAELQAEIKSLESRLEAMRTRSEEVVGSPVEGQAKQLRQIEALQRQYSVSKENWNGIQASLTARISALELERDDLTRREGDLRKKLRESVTALRRREEEFDSSKSNYSSLQEALHSERSLAKDLQISLSQARSDCDQLHQELRTAQEAVARNSETLIGESQAMSPQVSSPLDRSMSPFTTRKSSVFVPEAHEHKSMNALGLLTSTNTALKRPSSSRKISAVSPNLAMQSSQRHPSIASLTRSSSRSALRDSHSVSLDGEEEDRIQDLRTPVTPGQGFEEILTASASMPAAGPSVQMVERMTSAVRRLESEKAAARDELERMLLERDEARKQIVTLLEEAEGKNSLEKRVIELELEVTETTGRYRTTLELLGEKTETIEELKADIADMKHIYREALEKSIK